MTKYLFVLTSSPKDFFCEQTLVAIASLRVHNPGAFVTLLTDDKTAETLTGPRAVLKDAVDELNFDLNIVHHFLYSVCILGINTPLDRSYCASTVHSTCIKIHNTKSFCHTLCKRALA